MCILMLYICILTELEVHDVAPINIQTREDAVAVSLVNMLNMIPILEMGKSKAKSHYCCSKRNVCLDRSGYIAIFFVDISILYFLVSSGQRVREFPVFGVVECVYFKGIIDELSYNQKGELVLKELKTRKHDSLPSAAQALGHHFQVCEIFPSHNLFFLLKLSCHTLKISSNTIIVTFQETGQPN